MNSKPLLSVVTVSYNSAITIEDTIQSVLSQNFDNYEYIIIDGGSTDGTVDIIKKYQDKLKYWVSEPDNGISDAFNKGLSHCDGTYIGLLNSDDWYCRDALLNVSRGIQSSGSDIVCGKMYLWKDGEIAYHIISEPDLLKRRMSVCHPTCFVHRDLYRKIGGFNSSYKCAMDYEFLTRAIIEGATIYAGDFTVTNMRDGGVSSKYRARGQKEVLDIKKKYFGVSVLDYFFYYKELVLINGAQLARTVGLKCIVTAIRRLQRWLKHEK